MSYHRTPSGLSNQHLFFQVDVTVYVEGGPRSFTVEEVNNGHYSPSSVDLKYWQCMFSIFLSSERKCQFRAIGSKTTLRSIAGLIVSGHVTNVWVTMDRDYDNYHNELIPAPGILYTHGYSWENDVCIPDVLEEVFWAIAQIAKGSAPIKQEIETILAQEVVQLHRAVYLDILISYHSASLLPRDKPNSIWLTSGRYGKPSVNRTQLTRLIKQLRKQHPRPIYRPREIELLVSRDCVGHIMACLYHHILRYLLKKYSTSVTANNQLINSLMIEKLVSYMQLQRSGDVFAHYAGQFALLSSTFEDKEWSFAVQSRGFFNGLRSIFKKWERRD